jgi:hypothetical protein
MDSIKLRLCFKTIRDQKDIEKLREIALDLFTLARTLDGNRRGPNNYKVVVITGLGRLVTAAQGTKEYCQGYCDREGENAVVVCRNMIVYPEDRWGEYLDDVVD